MRDSRDQNGRDQNVWYSIGLGVLVGILYVYIFALCDAKFHLPSAAPTAINFAEGQTATSNGNAPQQPSDHSAAGGDSGNASPGPKQPAKDFKLGFAWQPTHLLGLGDFAAHVATAVQLKTNMAPIFLTPPDASMFAPGVSTHAQALLPILEHFDVDATENQDATDSAYPVVHLIDGFFDDPEAIDARWGPRNIAVVDIRSSSIKAAQLQRAKAFTHIMVGSEWNAKALRGQGLTNVDVVLPGAHIALHEVLDPATRASDLRPRCSALHGRFVVFSAGLFGYAAGHDLVLTAFERFRAVHPDASLAVAWQASPDQDDAALASSAVDPPADGDFLAWLERHGLPRTAIHDCGQTSPVAMAAALRDADVALFPARITGMANVYALEAIASGVPTILSDISGHKDLTAINGTISVPVSKLATGRKDHAFYREVTVEHIVELLEKVYMQRKAAARQGAVAAAFVKEHRSWEASKTEFIQMLAKTLR